MRKASVLFFKRMVGEVNCLDCCKPVVKDGLKCDQCEHWFHTSCEKITNNEYKVLGGIESVWFCKKCTKDFRKHKNVIKTDRADQTEKIENPATENIKISIINEIKETIPRMLQEEIEKHLNTTIHSQIEEVKALRGELKSDSMTLNKKIDSCLTYAKVTSKGLPINEKTMTSISEDVQKLKAQNDQVMTSISKDFQEWKTNFKSKQAEEKEAQARESKMNNVCFFNIPESKSNDPVQEAKDDSIKLQLILKNKIDLKKTDIKGLFRAGIKQTQKTRPIILQLCTVEKKLNLMKLRNLMYETNENTGAAVKFPIYVSPDRTKKQQEENRKLVQELKQKKVEDNENKYIIDHKLKKVVRFVPFRPRSQFYWD